MIDTHCHLTDLRLAEQLDDVLARAATAGVRQMITIGTDLDDDQAAITLCERLANVRCAVGIHPNYVTEAHRQQVSRLGELQAHPAVLAIGEMGLDYHYDRAPRTLQRELFEAQLQIADQVGKPVVIHCREAVEDTLAILRQFPRVRAVFHCFTGTPEEAEAIASAGYWIGFTGPVTFKKNDALREAARRVPIDRIVVETDAPYLSPEPMRKQKTNEPALVIHTAAVVAGLHGLSIEAFDARTTQNAKELFGWPGS